MPQKEDYLSFVRNLRDSYNHYFSSGSNGNGNGRINKKGLSIDSKFDSGNSCFAPLYAAVDWGVKEKYIGSEVAESFKDFIVYADKTYLHSRAVLIQDIEKANKILEMIINEIRK